MNTYVDDKTIFKSEKISNTTYIVGATSEGAENMIKRTQSFYSTAVSFLTWVIGIRAFIFYMFIVCLCVYVCVYTLE